MEVHTPLKPIETCPNGHRYNSREYHDTCPRCKQKIPIPPEPLTPEQTAALQAKRLADRVCAFLVCVNGRNKGRSYRVRQGVNTIGGTPSHDICLAGEPHTPKTRFCSIVYDIHDHIAYVAPGNTNEIAYLNANAIIQKTPVEPYDIICFVEMELMYIPFCCEEFEWG